jgi:hypothetical protein
MSVRDPFGKRIDGKKDAEPLVRDPFGDALVTKENPEGINQYSGGGGPARDIGHVAQALGKENASKGPNGKGMYSADSRDGSLETSHGDRLELYSKEKSPGDQQAHLQSMQAALGRQGIASQIGRGSQGMALHVQQQRSSGGGTYQQMGRVGVFRSRGSLRR